MSTKAVKRKAEDVGLGLKKGLLPTPPQPPTLQVHNKQPSSQQYFRPQGPPPMGMDFCTQQWMAGTGVGSSAWGGGPPRMMLNHHRGQGGNQRMYCPNQGRGIRPNHQNFNNFNQNPWIWQPPPFMYGMYPMTQGAHGFLNHAGTSWMPNRAIPPRMPPHYHQQSNFDGSHFEGLNKQQKEKQGGLGMCTSRAWNREDAERALALENELMKKHTDRSLFIRFPDQELSKDITRQFHPLIDAVICPVPFGPRFCFAQLVEGANVDKVISDLEKIKFGQGTLKVERKLVKKKDPLTPEAINPYTLYVGNLPLNINTVEIKEKFPTAYRVDVGYASKMRNTRYAFVKFMSVDKAMDAFRSGVNMQINSRSIVMRFRRNNRPASTPGESQSDHLKTIPKVLKITKEKVDADEDKKDDDEEKDDDDDKNDYGDGNKVEEDYNDDDNKEKEDDEEEDNDEENEEKNFPKVRQENKDKDDDDDDDEEKTVPIVEQEDDDDDKEDKFQDLFRKYKRKCMDLND